MGKLLELARQVPIVATDLEQEQAGLLDPGVLRDEREKGTNPAAPPMPGGTAAADVLALVGSLGPFPHSKIVASLAQSGRTKREAYEAIALLQRDRKIEHDLVTGYVLSSGE